DALAVGAGEGEAGAWPADLSGPVLGDVVAGEAGREAVREPALGGAGAGGLGGGAILARQHLADGPDPALAVQEAALAGAVRGGAGRLVTGEGARGRQRGGGVDPVGRRTPLQRAVLAGAALERLLEAGVRLPLRGGGEGAAALPGPDQPGQRVERLRQGGVERDGHRVPSR